MVEHTQVILKEMCKVVGADYGKLDFGGNEWYLTYEWTEEQENEFIKWLGEYFKKNKIVKHNGKRHYSNGATRDYAEHEASKWVANYGWKTKGGRYGGSTSSTSTVSPTNK